MHSYLSDHMSSTNQTNRFFLFLVNFFLISISYSIFLQNHLSIDSYSIIMAGSSATHHLLGGRFVSAALVTIFRIFGPNVVINQQIYTLVLMLLLTLSITILTRLFMEIIKTSDFIEMLFINGCLLISVINVFLAEWFHFPEASVLFGFGYLFSVIALKYFWSAASVGRIIISATFLLLAFSIYQAFVELFLIFSFCIALRFLLKQSDAKLVIKKIALAFIIIIVIVVLNEMFTLLLSKIFGAGTPFRQTRLALSDLLSRLLQILNYQKNFWISGLSLFPKFALAYSFIVFMVLGVLSLDRDPSKRLIAILLYIFSIFLMLITLWLPHLITAEFWPTARSMFAFFSVVSCILIYQPIANHKLQTLKVFFILIFILLNAIRIQDIGSDQIVTNMLDRNYALTVAREIQDYEKDTGLIVRNIAIMNDPSPLGGYPDYVNNISFDLNISARYVVWSNVEMIEFYSGIDLIEIPVDEQKFQSIFKNLNWDYYDDSQLFFEEDTLYLYVY